MGVMGVTQDVEVLLRLDIPVLETASAVKITVGKGRGLGRVVKVIGDIARSIEQTVEEDEEMVQASECNAALELKVIAANVKEKMAELQERVNKVEEWKLRSEKTAERMYKMRQEFYQQVDSYRQQLSAVANGAEYTDHNVSCFDLEKYIQEERAQEIEELQQRAEMAEESLERVTKEKLRLKERLLVQNMLVFRKDRLVNNMIDAKNAALDNLFSVGCQTTEVETASSGMQTEEVQYPSAPPPRTQSLEDGSDADSAMTDSDREDAASSAPSVAKQRSRRLSMGRTKTLGPNMGRRLTDGGRTMRRTKTDREVRLSAKALQSHRLASKCDSVCSEFSELDGEKRSFGTNTDCVEKVARGVGDARAKCSSRGVQAGEGLDAEGMNANIGWRRHPSMCSDAQDSIVEGFSDSSGDEEAREEARRKRQPVGASLSNKLRGERTVVRLKRRLLSDPLAMGSEHESLPRRVSTDSAIDEINGNKDRVQGSSSMRSTPSHREERRASAPLASLMREGNDDAEQPIMRIASSRGAATLNGCRSPTPTFTAEGFHKVIPPMTSPGLPMTARRSLQKGKAQSSAEAKPAEKPSEGSDAPVADGEWLPVTADRGWWRRPTTGTGGQAAGGEAAMRPRSPDAERPRTGGATPRRRSTVAKDSNVMPSLVTANLTSMLRFARGG